MPTLTVIDAAVDNLRVGYDLDVGFDLYRVTSVELGTPYFTLVGPHGDPIGREYEIPHWRRFVIE